MKPFQRFGLVVDIVLIKGDVIFPIEAVGLLRPARMMLPLYSLRRTVPVRFCSVDCTKASRALRRGVNHWPL